MSNRPFRIFYALIVIVVLLACLMISTCSPSSAKRFPENDSSFRVVNDRPIIESLDRYYELVWKGKTTITVDGQKYDVFWSDFSTEEKQNIQLRLRTP